MMVKSPNNPAGLPKEVFDVLVVASGAGAEMRQALGTVVFFGMLGVTIFGLFLAPVFYNVIRQLTGRKVGDQGAVQSPVETK